MSEWIRTGPDLLKHDKALSKDPPAPHLRDVPDYLLDQKTREASKMVKLTRAAMGDNKSARRQGAKKKFRKSRNPLKTFSAEVHDHQYIKECSALLQWL